MAPVTTELKVAVKVAGEAGLDRLSRSLINIGKQAQSSSVKFDQISRKLQAVQKNSSNSIATLRNYRNAWRDIAEQVEIGSKEFRKATAEAERLEKQIAKAQGRRGGGGRLSGFAQGIGTVAGAGVFGGPEGALGAAGGLALGGVTGAITGGAIGAQVKQLREAISGTAEYAAEIQKLKIALEGVAGSQAEYVRALESAEKATRQLNVPQEIAIQGITRLTAAIKGAGGTVADADVVFQNITKAIKATGGGAQDVQGALTAMVQVFSKGKVSAEELSGQLGERLPGAVTLFAKANGLTLEELQKLLKEGKVGLNELMKFIQLLGTEYGQTALKIAASNADAGARLQVAINDLSLKIGEKLIPIGAQFQAAFAEFIEDITPALVELLPKIAEFVLFLAQNLDVAVVAITAFGAALGALQLGAYIASIGGLTGAISLLTTGIGATTVAVRGLTVAMAANPYLLIAAGVAATAAVIYKNNQEQERYNRLLASAPLEEVTAEIGQMRNQLIQAQIASQKAQSAMNQYGASAAVASARVQDLNNKLATLIARQNYLSFIRSIGQEPRAGVYGPAFNQPQTPKLTDFSGGYIPPAVTGGGGGSAAPKITEITADELRLQENLLDAKLAQSDVEVARLTKALATLQLQEKALGVNAKAAELAKIEYDYKVATAQILEKQAQRDADNERSRIEFFTLLDKVRVAQGEITKEQQAENANMREAVQLQGRFSQLVKDGVISQEDLSQLIRGYPDLLKKAAEKAYDFKEEMKKLFEAAGKLGENLEKYAIKATTKLADTFADFVATGKADFADFTRSVLQDLARIFARAALFKGLSLIPGVGNFLGLTGSANGNVFAKNKIVPFAYGGIVNKPTIFPMANGAGLMGEAGPEAIMPLRRNAKGRLGVEASGGVGNVVVNVDASGSSVQGDGASANQLGKAIGIAVQQELVKQKRPGGLLA